MKRIQIFAAFLVSVLLVFSASLRAEDIDVYVANSKTVGTPNVLFIIDNGADFSATANIGCDAYDDGTGAPSTGTDKTSGVLQCALVNAIGSLNDGAVNIGVMVSNANSFAETQATSDITKGGYHEACATGGNGGCLLQKLTPMDKAGKANLISFIKGWLLSGQNTKDTFNIKVNSSYQAETMQEAWAYYHGKEGMSGTTYSPSILANGCQRNFVVYISNTQKTPNSSESGPASAALAAEQVGATDAQKKPITGTVTFSPGVCPETRQGTTTYTTSYKLESGNNWADEWARLMYQQDGGASGNHGIQSIISYTIGIQSSGNQCSVDTYGLISSMATRGNGKFFNTSNVRDLTEALKKILNEVQAVNSVFSSASLPVSVNAQGTYLNQIFLGMFRPDASASPRWLGNLKQYKLIYDNTGALVLGDKDGNAAISSSGTGFISPTAVSYWTYKDTSNSPDSLGGTFVNREVGTPPSGYDMPDGEVVEKGGAAQQLRKENLIATFAGASNTSTNPRRLYTYCPKGSGCEPRLTESVNDFSTENFQNLEVPASVFGTSSTIRVTSLTRSGTTVTARTIGNHGLTSGTSVTISGANEPRYNGTITIASASGNTFTYSISAEYPNTKSQRAYTVAKASSAINLTGVSRTGTTATITSADDLSKFTAGSTVMISGFNQPEYNGNSINVLTNSGNSLTYTVSENPPTTVANTYTADYPVLTITSITVSGNGNNKVATVKTATAHNFRDQQTVKLSGTGVAAYDEITFTITYDSANPNQFTISPGKDGAPASKGTVKRTATAQTLTSLTRSATTATAVIGSSAGFANGDTVAINKSGGSATNETAYEMPNGVVISCTSPCTTFTYPVTVSPTTPGTFSGTPTISFASGSGTIAVGDIDRVLGSTTATAKMAINSGTFSDGDSVNISDSTGSTLATESAYAGTHKISCTSPCTTFTFSDFKLTPATPDTGTNIVVHAGSVSPDRDTLIKWLRGQDNFGDESGPGSTVTVRPSIHADVLHSRPLVLNYGDTARGIVVFYGSNDGVFHAVNGNQSGAIGSVPAGGELWGLVLPEHFASLNRQRVASPELRFPTTTFIGAATKDYFVDGPTGAYQKLKKDGSIDKAYIYLTMRRGGQFIYALDVSTPTSPKVLWRIDTDTPGFSELGQTWSRPRFTLLESSNYRTRPVLIFGAGYDTAEDAEPPATDNMGRGIYIVDALDGTLIWSATPTCTTSDTCLQVPGMTHAIPSDVAFVDRNLNGYTDKLYVGDLGGNVWRFDVSDALRSNWTATKIAALGCSTGACSAGTTPRKFFFPPSVLTIKGSGASGSYDAISLVSGDREHPLKSSASGSSYGTADKFFMLKDTATAIGSPPSDAPITMTGTKDLFNATSTLWDGSKNGIYISFATGEKGVNAPLAVNGVVYFSTNRPVDSTLQCAANLGEAKAYAVSPFTGAAATNVLAGGGMPPSPVAGVVNVTKDGRETQETFCIGCGLASSPLQALQGSPGTPPGSTPADDEPGPCTGNAALQQCNRDPDISANLRRTYWYKK